MDINLHNSYLFQALDAYPYSLEETLEALNYALSYNSKDPQALCLMGRIYAEQLKDFETAKHYYAEAVAQAIDMPVTYPFYVHALVMNDDYNEAERLISFALTVRGVDKGQLKLLQGILFEKQGMFKRAITSFTEAKSIATSDAFITHVDGAISRVQKKAGAGSWKKKKKKRKKKGSETSETK
ncbi:hypothetical protein [Seonamhaeicola sp.]|uniref:tetratricopeptide repeat protein n=1 Tax=Seonamhaeicola sp. TaxID=1912245 RepID=UPI002633BE54|nr:hypothetical protein [Seonamhaeicola sp.]